MNTSDVPRYPCVCLQGAPPARMRLFIALPVLIVVLAMTLEGKKEPWKVRKRLGSVKLVLCLRHRLRRPSREGSEVPFCVIIPLPPSHRPPSHLPGALFLCQSGC